MLSKLSIISGGSQYKEKQGCAMHSWWIFLCNYVSIILKFIKRGKHESN